MPVDLTQVSPEVLEAIRAEFDRREAAARAESAPKELSPDEKVDAALAAIYTAERRERTAPGHNDHIVSAIVTWVQAITDRYAAVEAAAVAADQEAKDAAEKKKPVEVSAGPAAMQPAVGVAPNNTSNLYPSYQSPAAPATSDASAVEAAAPLASD